MDGQNNWDPNAPQGQTDPNQPTTPGIPPSDQGNQTPTGDTGTGGGVPTWTPPTPGGTPTNEPSSTPEPTTPPTWTPPAETPAEEPSTPATGGGDTGTDKTGEEPAV